MQETQPTLSMQNQSPRVTLKAGTRVKHGTTAANLRSILEIGLRPGFARHKLREITEEIPSAPAVYVGGLSAYFGAWASTTALTKEYELAEPAFTRIATSDNQALLRAGDYSEPPLAIPIVLEIELQEDTGLVGDEDYAVWKEGSKGSRELIPESTNSGVWSRYLSGGLLKEREIPSSWIVAIEFPQLMRADQQIESQFKRLLPDCHLFAASIHQNHTLSPATAVRIGADTWRPTSQLSQRWSFSSQEVDRFLTLPAISLKQNRLHNMILQYSLVSSIGADEYRIKFA